MDLQNLAVLLQQLIRRGDITVDEARAIMRLVAAGQVSDEQLPLPPAMAVGQPVTEEERSRSYLFVLLLLGYSLTPTGRLSQDQRRIAHERLTARLEELAATYAAAGAAGNVRSWHADMQAAIRAAILRQAAAGSGTQATEPGIVDQEIRDQMSWLYYYAGAMAARLLIGRPMGAGYIAWRSRLYAGAPWAMFYRMQEWAGDNDAGWVVYYDAVDDRNTCSPCRQAEAGGPYLPGQGPMPGDVCEGGGACRCVRRAVYDPEAYRALTGVAV